MRLTQKTFDTLKGFSSINQSVVIRPGNVLETMSPQKTFQCFSTVPEHFPIEFGIYNLDHFLKLIKRMSEGRGDTEGVELEFQEDNDDNAVVISNSRMQVRYPGGNPDMIVRPPQDENGVAHRLTLPSVDFAFSITREEIDLILGVYPGNSYWGGSVTITRNNGKVTALFSQPNEKVVGTIELEDTIANTDFEVTYRVLNLAQLPKVAVYSVRGSMCWKTSKGAGGISEFTVPGLLSWVASEAAPNAQTYKHMKEAA